MIEADVLAVNVQIDSIGAGRNGVGASIGHVCDEYNFITDHHFLGYMDKFGGHQIIITLRCFKEGRSIRQRRKQKNC